MIYNSCKTCGLAWHSNEPMDYCESCQEVPFEKPEINLEVEPPVRTDKVGHIRQDKFRLEPRMQHELSVEAIARMITSDPDVHNETG